MPLTPHLSDEFNRRFAAWLRIESRCRVDEFGPGVKAQTADGLWFLTRQWQTAEFHAEDAGSPIKVDLGYSTQSVDNIVLGKNIVKPYQINTTPLESLIEQEQGTINYRERVRIGQEFERRLKSLLQDSGNESELALVLQTLRDKDGIGFPKEGNSIEQTLDRETLSFVRFMTGKVIDGLAILSVHAELTATSFTSVVNTAIEEARQSIITWYGKVCARPDAESSSAWQSESLDYQFETNKAAEDAAVEDKKINLIAPDYRNGAVDWYTFESNQDTTQNWAQTAEHFSPDDTASTTPTRIEVAGTSPRWWAFEDGHINFGAMNMAKPDLAKLLLLEIALIYGDDWFSVPANVALGSLARVDQLNVYNVFGEKVEIEPARKVAGDALARFEMFTLSSHLEHDAPGLGVSAEEESSTRPLLFVPPVSGYRMESKPIDEVLFVRDEGANMVWGIEKWVQNGIGKAIDGFDAQRERLERANAVEESILNALIDDVEQQLQSDSLTEDERAVLLKQKRLAQARLEELKPFEISTPSQDDVPRFRLASTVPENWIPFIPQQRHSVHFGLLRPKHIGVQFRRAKMLRNTDHAKLDSTELTPAILENAATNLGLPPDTFTWMAEAPNDEAVPSLSRLLALNEHALLWLDEEAVPRAGLRVQLTKQRARWIDGSTHVWVGRKVLTGAGEGASGLKFDSIHE